MLVMEGVKKLLYNTVLFIHILGVIVMFIGIGITIAAMIAMLHSRTVEQLCGFSLLAKKADGLIPFSAILIVFPGIYLVLSNWKFGHAWIDLSFVVLIAMTLMGPIINHKRIKEIDRMANSSTELTSKLMNIVKNKVLWTSLSVMSMFTTAIVFLMIVKFEMAGTLITFAVAIILGVMFSNLLLRGGPTSFTSTSDVRKEM